MQEVLSSGLTLHFEKEDESTLALFRESCNKSVQLIQEHWKLPMPKDCRVYIMTSWAGFMFPAATWPWKILMALTAPLWLSRVKKVWAIAGGWEQRFGSRVAVGVKPPRLLANAPKKLGQQLFIEEDIEGKVQNVICHELTHAFSSHLRLPTWLKEGLAMLTVDKYFSKATIQESTLAWLDPSKESIHGDKRERIEVDNETLLLHTYAQAYWLTRYLDETQPTLLQELLTQRLHPNKLKEKVASSYEQKTDIFWKGINERLITHFGR